MSEAPLARSIDHKVPASEVKHQLLTFARTIGFDSCRIAACSSPPHKEEFQNWLDEGGHGEMSYMERGKEKRCDPHKLLPGASSIVVIALNYFQGQTQPSRTAGPTGRIARYAWGDDYHDLITNRLEKIDQFLRGFGGQQKYYVDTGPLLERDYAAEAGIGWHGKSTMLIDQRLGTWFFLAEVLTTLELPPDEPVADRCGTCDRCIRACPTGAIMGPHRLDARRCVSYLTIELRGSIPSDLRPMIGDRIFGCDDCLDACPWNRFAKASRETAFSARPSTIGVRLRDYLGLSDEDFRVLFRGSPIKRIKRRGFLRNVCVALGNVGDASDLPALELAAADREPIIAEHADWAIQQIRGRHNGAIDRSWQQSNPPEPAVIH
jgi:epoxyqueuosine reductase